MSLLDEFFDDKAKINYKPSSLAKGMIVGTVAGVSKMAVGTSKALFKGTGSVAKHVYFSNVSWCKSFYKTDIYNKCKDELSKQIKNCIGMDVSEVVQFIDLPFANDYWLGDIQKKYTKQQLRRIEQELEDEENEKTNEDLCYEMLVFVCNKVIPKNIQGILTENDVFKIKNRCKED